MQGYSNEWVKEPYADSTESLCFTSENFKHDLSNNLKKFLKVKGAERENTEFHN